MTAQHFDPETVHSCSYHCQRPACIVRRESREILALSLGEFGHYQEAENVLKGIDLDEYRFELYAIQSALSKRGAAVPKPEKTTQEPVEMSPEFTDTARAAITWVLYHHQGGGSPIGQPLRFALGMGAHDPLPEWRIAEAKRYAEFAGATTAKFHGERASAPAAPSRLVEAARDVIEAIRAIPESSLLSLDFDPHPPSSLSVHADDLEAALASANPGSPEADHLPDATKMVVDARDAARLDWLDANGFTAYRHIDPIDGLSSHCVVVHETQRPRRGNVHDTIRGAIDAAMAGEVQP